MKYGDFSSLVQLGVGLHIGTALLQLYGDIGEAPLVRKLTRIRNIIESEENPTEKIMEELAELEGDYEIFKIRFFNEYKKYIKVNAVVAAILAISLVLISYMNDEPLPASLSVLFVYFSIVPAPQTLAMLWGDAERALAPLKERADKLEKLVLRRAA